MIKIFHCADIHLDSPFSLYSPREAESRRTELRAAFTGALMFAREQGADLFLISGDLFDGEFVTRDTLELLSREFRRSADMRFFIAPGNHDHLGPGSPYNNVSFPPNVHVFGKERECVRIDELGADIYGFGFDSQTMISSPVAGWQGLDPRRINILVCHGDTSSPHSETGPVTMGDIAASGFDYIALGHIHKGTGVMSFNGVSYAYPGCLEGRGFDELGYKGALFGTVDKGRADLKSYRFSNRRYELAEVDLTGIADKSEALEVIRRGIKQYVDDTALRLTLTGELKQAFVILPNEIGTGREFPYSIELIDNTFIAPNIGELEKTNTIKGIFCRNLAARISASPEGSEERRIYTLALKYGLAALDGRSVVDYRDPEERR